MSRADPYALRRVRTALAAGPLREAEIRLCAGIGTGATKQALWALRRSGEVVRSGEPGGYRYALSGP